MFNFNWLRGQAPSTSRLPMDSIFDSGVVCPDGTVMWLWNEDDASNHWSGDADRCPSQRSSLPMDHSLEHIHYHYHRFGMGPWLFVGLQMSLAIALILVLSVPQPPVQDAPVDSLAITQADNRIGFFD